MIIVRVELWSAITGTQTELARMHISNCGTNANPRRGDYEGVTFIGRKSAVLDRLAVSKRGELKDFPRQQLHVWNMVARMLAAMGYQ
jgi:hypothetical protein